MSSWITGAAAVARLREAGVANPEVLGIWAGDGMLRARASVERMSGKVQHERFGSRDDDSFVGPLATDDIQPWFWGHLRADPKLVDWSAGVFETVVEIENEFVFVLTLWRMSGVTFNADDLEALLDRGGPSSPATSPRGVLPASAKPGDRMNEAAAHAAAEIVRTDGCAPAKAFRRVAPAHIRESVDTGSMERAIRRAYDQMYDRRGQPLQN